MRSTIFLATLFLLFSAAISEVFALTSDNSLDGSFDGLNVLNAEKPYADSSSFRILLAAQQNAAAVAPPKKNAVIVDPSKIKWEEEERKRLWEDEVRKQKWEEKERKKNLADEERKKNELLKAEYRKAIEQEHKVRSAKIKAQQDAAAAVAAAVKYKNEAAAVEREAKQKEWCETGNNLDYCDCSKWAPMGRSTCIK